MAETYTEKLNEIYNIAIRIYSGKEKKESIEDSLVEDDINTITTNAEKVRGVVAVVTTLMVHKALFPEQDIRYYQQKMKGGFSAGTVDTNFITPFLKDKDFPAPSTTGWLTRTLESSQPYLLDYKPAIKPDTVKRAFLDLIDKVENKQVDPNEVLKRLFYNLIVKRENERLDDLAKPHNLSIADIISLLREHFTYKYIGGGSGASRLPVLALYSAYQCMMTQVKRYDGKKLPKLSNHTSADTRSGSIGDIEVLEENGEAFEGVEVKHEIEITTDIIKIAYEKFKSQQTKRYYILTTSNMDAADWDSINFEIRKIRDIHGCQVIVNGVYSSLTYYLRLLDDTSKFIDYYVENLKNDETLKFQHKKSWNDIVSKRGN